MIDFKEDLDKCLEVLKSGGLILYPTDTAWSIGCDATNEAAVAKIYDLKHREDSTKMIVLMASEKEVMQYVTNLDLAIFDYLETSVKPTTVIYEGVIGLAENIMNEDGSIAIRICKDSFCKNLIRRFQKPIVSTSANLSGEPTPSMYLEIDNNVISRVDYIVKYRQNDEKITSPSAAIKWKNESEVIIFEY
jgi:L-threonylcarbamoyladenylate synthase